MSSFHSTNCIGKLEYSYFQLIEAQIFVEARHRTAPTPWFIYLKSAVIKSNCSVMQHFCVFLHKDRSAALTETKITLHKGILCQAWFTEPTK
ncbi:hypothetical protein NIES4073_13210 [Kalymmatonema gypsitolerans NIES-4073]|nr:hypothetical protein NIES4073_13210 [Scytonema sp. NIES-4073]